MLQTRHSHTQTKKKKKKTRKPKKEGIPQFRRYTNPIIPLAFRHMNKFDKQKQKAKLPN